MVYDKILKDMDKINIAILEDDLKELEITFKMLKEFFDNEKISCNITTFSDPNEFLKLNFEIYDLALLDILLNTSINGMDVAKRMREKNKNIAIMFITKTAQFALEGYSVDAVDYVLKPLSYYEFSLKLKKALNFIKNNSSKTLAFKTVDGIVKLNEDDILYIEVISHYLYVNTVDNHSYKVRGTMSNIVDSLSSKFSRTSNSFLINLKHVKKVSSKEVTLSNSKVIPLTSLYKMSFLESFMMFTSNS